MEFELKDIDERFFNSDNNKPFEKCQVCDINVQQSGGDYFVERIFRRLPGSDSATEVLFEYALCQKCAEQLRNELSKESLENIETYFTERVMAQHERGESSTTNNCLLTGKPISDSEEFSLHAHCRGDKMVQSIFPYAISDQAMDEVSELLSQHTIDQLDDFKGNYFTGPPEFADLLNPKRLLPL